ncbi:MAG: hypothetical protein QG599_2737, partial [Pseudomonadota bacterium]|nr:hypothetical protein [Pseudomonadota bacterium]
MQRLVLKIKQLLVQLCYRKY